MNEKRKITIGCSPITSKIYAGKLTKKGLWGTKKEDVTDEAISAVAQCLLQRKEKLVFSHEGKSYELVVNRSLEINNTQENE